MVARQKIDRRAESLIAPLLEASYGDYETRYFNGTFLFPSIWRGKPSEDLDRAWDDLVDGKANKG